ncbi:hypothetical protein K505DRAFT_322713, partial [Melanomma pulvis-pyrius CBS 109.77]
MPMTSSESGDGTRTSEGSSERPSPGPIDQQHHNQHTYRDNNHVFYSSTYNSTEIIIIHSPANETPNRAAEQWRRQSPPPANWPRVPNSDINGIALQLYPRAVSNRDLASHPARLISGNAEHVEREPDAAHSSDTRNDREQGEPLEGAAVRHTVTHWWIIMLIIAILVIVKLSSRGTESTDNNLKSSNRPLSIDMTHSMPSSAAPSSASEVPTAPMTTQPSSSKLPYASSPISPTPPFSPATTDLVSMTSLLFDITAPPKAITNGTTTSICTPWSGAGCPGIESKIKIQEERDMCHSETCQGILPCWNGRCCMTACLAGWECTGECADGLSCSKATDSATGRCTTT